MAASFISSGGCQSRPFAFALSTMLATVAVEHPHENATLRTLTPMALSLWISLCLTISFSFSLDCKGALRAIWIALEKKTPLAGRILVLRVEVYQPTVERCGGAAWNGVAKVMQ